MKQNRNIVSYISSLIIITILCNTACSSYLSNATTRDLRSLKWNEDYCQRTGFLIGYKATDILKPDNFPNMMGHRYYMKVQYAWKFFGLCWRQTTYYVYESPPDHVECRYYPAAVATLFAIRKRVTYDKNTGLMCGRSWGNEPCGNKAEGDALCLYATGTALACGKNNTILKCVLLPSPPGPDFCCPRMPNEKIVRPVYTRNGNFFRPEIELIFGNAEKTCQNGEQKIELPLTEEEFKGQMPMCSSTQKTLESSSPIDYQKVTAILAEGITDNNPTVKSVSMSGHNISVKFDDEKICVDQDNNRVACLMQYSIHDLPEPEISHLKNNEKDFIKVTYKDRSNNILASQSFPADSAVSETPKYRSFYNQFVAAVRLFKEDNGLIMPRKICQDGSSVKMEDKCDAEGKNFSIVMGAKCLDGTYSKISSDCFSGVEGSVKVKECVTKSYEKNKSDTMHYVGEKMECDPGMITYTENESPNTICMIGLPNLRKLVISSDGTTYTKVSQYTHRVYKSGESYAIGIPITDITTQELRTMHIRGQEAFSLISQQVQKRIDYLYKSKTYSSASGYNANKETDLFLSDGSPYYIPDNYTVVEDLEKFCIDIPPREH